MLLKRPRKPQRANRKRARTGIERPRQRLGAPNTIGNLEADYCVIATGCAQSPSRRRHAPTVRTIPWYALGYFVPTEQEHIDIQFLRNLEGYIWVFPRHGHLSVGICGKSESAPVLRARLERYMDERGTAIRIAKFYGHVLPSLESSRLAQ